jgi:hypothetical protein
VKQIKTAWEIICAFFSAPESAEDEAPDRYSIWATAEQLKGTDNVTVLTPATRRRYRLLRDGRKFKVDRRSKK